MKELKQIIKNYYILEADKSDFSNRVESIVNAGPYIMFFKFEDEIYGADEPQRLAYARLKHPDDDDDTHDSFMAISLCSILNGSQSDRKFDMKDLKGIEVIEDPKQVVKQVTKNCKSDGEDNVIQVVTRDTDDEPRPDLREKPSENYKKFLDYIRKQL